MHKQKSINYLISLWCVNVSHLWMEKLMVIIRKTIRTPEHEMMMMVQ